MISDWPSFDFKLPETFENQKRNKFGYRKACFLVLFFLLNVNSLIRMEQKVTVLAQTINNEGRIASR